MSPNRLVIVEGLLRRFQAGEKQTRNSEVDMAESKSQLKDWFDMPACIKQMPPTTVLIFFDPDMDTRGHNPLLKTLASLADKVYQLNEIKGKELVIWIKEYALNNGGKMGNAAASLLADYIGGDLWALTSEIDKLITFCGGSDITENDVREISSLSREESIFALVDAILEGKVKDAQAMLHRMLKYGAAPQQILAMVERQLVLILRVKEIMQDTSIPEIREKLGLNPRYPLDKTLKQARSFTIPRIRKAFHHLLDTDIAIKTGQYEDELALNLMVIELCRP
jgi:DNA polymerase-3 subunit delta